MLAPLPMTFRYEKELDPDCILQFSLVAGKRRRASRSRVLF